MENEALVTIQFNNGYATKQILSLIDKLVENVPLYMYKDHFEIKHAVILNEQTNKNLAVFMQPDMDRIIKYETDEEYFKKHDHIVIVPLKATFIKYISDTKKKETLQFKVMKSDPTSLLVDFCRSTSDICENTSFPHMPEVSLFNIDIPDYRKDKCNVKINAIDLSKHCSSINKDKKIYKHVSIRGYEHGMKLNGVNESHTMKNQEVKCKWGKCKEKSYIDEYTIDLDKNAALVFIKTMADHGVVATYFYKDKMILDIPVETFARIVMVVNNGEEIIDEEMEKFMEEMNEEFGEEDKASESDDDSDESEDPM